MRKYIFSLSLLLLLLLQLSAQQQSTWPSPAHWGQSVFEAGQVYWLDEMGKRTPIDAGSSQVINYWRCPLLPFAKLPLTVDLPPQQATIIVVAQSINPKEEQTLWSWQQGDKPSLVLTNQRLADLEKPAYLNLSGLSPHPRVRTYVHRTAKKAPGTGQLTFGQAPTQLALPIDDWNGTLAEYLIYDRVLTPKERQIAETYLALKYGLTLRQLGLAVNYLDSNDEVVWAGAEQTTFHHRILGVCRDRQWGLRQNNATSVLAPEAVNLRITDAETYNGAAVNTDKPNFSLVLGDNDAPWLWEMKDFQTNIQQLTRQWLVQGSGAYSDIITDLRLEAARWAASPLDDEYTYWLAVDERAEGTFHPSDTKYYKVSGQGLGHFIHFKELLWDKDRSGTDVFTVVQAPAFWASVDIQEPNCDENVRGELWLQAVGGKAPYQLVLAHENGEIVAEQAIDKHWAYNNLAIGNYLLTLQDATGERFVQPLNIQAVDAPQTDLQTNYTLAANGELHLMPRANRNTTHWAWYQGDALISTAAELRITSPGAYSLELMDGECSRKHSFVVAAAKQTDILQAIIYPNPVQAGQKSRWRVHAPGKHPLLVQLTDVQGKVLEQQSYSADTYYSQPLVVRMAGTYWLHFSAGPAQTSLKLIVQ